MGANTANDWLVVTFTTTAPDFVVHEPPPLEPADCFPKDQAVAEITAGTYEPFVGDLICDGTRVWECMPADTTVSVCNLN